MAGSSKGLDLPERGKRRIDERGDNFGSFAGTGAEDESAAITGAPGRRRPSNLAFSLFTDESRVFRFMVSGLSDVGFLLSI